MAPVVVVVPAAAAAEGASPVLESLQRTGIDFGGLTMTLLAPSTAVVSKTPEVIVAVSCWFQFQHSVIEREAVPH